MRWNHIGRVGALILSVALLFGPLMPVTWARAKSAPMASVLTPSAQTPDVLWLDGDLAEILLSEAIVLLGCALACGLVVGGMEALDRWRERRTKKKGPRTRVPGLAS